MRNAKRLTAMQVANLAKPGRYGDGNGLVLQVSKEGTKSWLFRFERGGRERQMGLGPVAVISLAEARQKAIECRKALLEGLDPIETRRAARMNAQAEAARSVTFRECAERYIAAHEGGWRNEKHRAQWKSTLNGYAYPVIGDLAVGAVDTGLVLKIIEPIWAAKPDTAGRIRGRIELVLDWARARGFRSGENPARWRGHIDKLLPSRSKMKPVKHHPALPYPALPAFMAELKMRAGMSARALEFTILTASRSNEVLGARWDEFDIDANVWIVPGSRMKGGREHRVPLSDRSLELLQSQSRDSEFVFPNVDETAPLSNMAMLELLRGMRPGFVPHGFRSTFRDWAAETTNYPNHVVEMALAHVVGDKVEAAYRRGDLFEKRCALMSDWAAYCMSAIGQTSPVIEFRQALKKTARQHG